MADIFDSFDTNDIFETLEMPEKKGRYAAFKEPKKRIKESLKEIKEEAKKTGRLGGTLAQETGLGALTSVPDLMSAIDQLTQKIIPLPEKAKGGFDPYKMLTSESVKGALEPYLLKPESIAEKAAARTGRLAGSGLGMGVPAKTALTSALGGAVGGQAAEELGGGEIAQTLGELGGMIGPDILKKGAVRIGAALGVKPAVASRQASQFRTLERAVKGNADKQNIVNFAKQYGLNPEETTLLLQSEGKVDKLGKFARKTSKFKSTAESLKEKLGQNYEELKDLGQKGGWLSVEEAENLQDDLGKILQDIQKTYIEGPDTKGARALIEEALFKVENRAGTVEDLINSRQNLRQAVNWKNVDPKGAILKKTEKALTTAIEKKNPAIAKRLKETDEAWGKYKKFEKLLNEKAGLTEKLLNLSPGFLPKLAFGASLNLKTVGTPYLATEASKRLITKLLLDPKYQSINRNLQNALISGSVKSQTAIVNLLKKQLKKDDPEIYNDIFEELEYNE
jgi:hypothetical protein